MQQYEFRSGMHISTAVKAMIQLAKTSKDAVTGAFNDIPITVTAKSDPKAVVRQYSAECKRRAIAYRKSPEGKAAKRKAREEARTDAGYPKGYAALADMSESELREARSPWPKNAKQLNELVRVLTTRPHDYGTCVYAMSLAATGAFHFICHQLGTTGFQTTCADLDFLRRNRLLKGPFRIVDAEKLCYPQYDVLREVKDWITECWPWVCQECRRKLKESPDACAEVKAHWTRLAAVCQEPPNDPK